MQINFVESLPKTKLFLNFNFCSICENAEWQCESNDCSAICTMWGASNYQTFDGKIFNFQGDCEYVVVKGQIDDANSFVVSTENVPCGTTGVTCSKSISLLLSKYILKDKFYPDNVKFKN